MKDLELIQPSLKQFSFALVEFILLVAAFDNSVSVGFLVYLLISALYAYSFYVLRFSDILGMGETNKSKVKRSLQLGLCWPLIFVTSIVALVFNFFRRK